MRYLFDYQELAGSSTAPTDRSIKPVLDDLTAWGYDWLRTVPGDYDYALIQSWQLPLTLHNADLNADGTFGFRWIGSQPTTYERAQARPIVTQLQGNDFATPRATFHSWSPHGQPAFIRGPDGELTTFEYYRLTAAGAPHYVFGSPAPPTDEVSDMQRGFVGRVRSARFGTEPVPAGPTDTPCPRLKGPYQWVLPATCVAPAQELAALGLPPEAVQAVLLASRETPNPPRPGDFATTAFSYNFLGGVRYEWSENYATHFVRDTDGREVQRTDPLQNTVTSTYSRAGLPESITMTDSAGTLQTYERRGYDETGALVLQCLAEAEGDCVKPSSGSVRTFEYTARRGVELDHRS